MGEALCNHLSGLFPACQGIYGVDYRESGWSKWLPTEASLKTLLESEGLDRDGLRLVVFHCGALHKPQVRTHAQKCFVESNISFTLLLLELLEGLSRSTVEAFVYTSTTSVLAGQLGGGRCMWLDGGSAAEPKNVYGWSKLAAEGLCKLHSGSFPVLTLRACRFFPEEDDREAVPGAPGVGDEDNLKFLDTLIGRRLTLRDVVHAHVAGWRATARETRGYRCLMLGNRVGLGEEDLEGLWADPAGTVCAKYPGLSEAVERRGWVLFTHPIDRVVDASETFEALKWEPMDTPFQFIQDLSLNQAIPSW